MGDYNQPILGRDKKGDKSINAVKAQGLLDMVNGCNLIDLGYQGPRYTWTNCRQGLANIREQLDWVWCNLAWHKQYEEAWLKHLPRAHLDHHLILLGGLMKVRT